MHTRSTFDYSPLRGPIMNEHGRDISGRNKYERQQYEKAVNARKEMLKLMENHVVPPKRKCKNYKDWQRGKGFLVS